MARPRWKRTTIAAVKAVVAVLVLWAVGRHVLRTWHDLSDHRVTLPFEPAWLVVSGLLYLAGLSACGVFYERILAGEPDAGPARPGAAGVSRSATWASTCRARRWWW